MRLLAHLRHWWVLAYKIHRKQEWKISGVRIGLVGLSDSMKETIALGKYEKAEAAACRILIRPGDRIFELGGAIGFIGLHSLINCGASSVVSVEANPETAQRLRDNYALNQRTAHVIVAAVAANQGSVRFSIGADFWTDALGSTQKNGKEVTVDGRTFTDLWQEAPASNVLVVDIEGAEHFIDWAALPVGVQKIILEIHPEMNGWPAAFGLLKIIMDAGYEVQFAEENVFGLQKIGLSASPRS